MKIAALNSADINSPKNGGKGGIMKIIKIRNIGPFIVGVLDGGELNCHRTYERVYMHDSDGFSYSPGGKYAVMRKENDPENIEKLNSFVARYI